jgi:hypothetical protein
MHHYARTSALAASLLVCVGCSAPGIEVDFGYMQSRLAGDVRLAPSAALPLPSQSVDLAEDLGFDDAGSLYARAEVDLSVPHLTISGFSYAEHGEGTLSAQFGNIMASVPVESNVEIHNVKGALTFDLIDIGPVRLSPGAAITLIDYDQTVTGAGMTERFNQALPVPLLFLQGEVDLGIVSATVDAGALDVEVMDVDGTFVDVEALVKIHPWDHVEFFAGYRLISADVDGTIDDQRFSGLIDLQGLMIGGGVSF